uniref:Probable protein-export membrane protein SecG n=1 Tax=Balbiania investiens TaxID=111861 RepID=A0A4D6BN60_9FLOR|nr:preprotein translocase subunit G [Balbiania investiens]QBX88638.1 preprotein translocase subunit G [Balbiania investiens]
MYSRVIIMKLLWYLVGLTSIIFILMSNPKSEGLGNLGVQTQLFNNTRQAQSTLETMTQISILIFLLLTIIFALS